MSKIKIFEHLANKDFTVERKYKVDDGTEKFYENLEEWATVPVDDWNHVNILAYFCYKYESKHDIRFRLSKSKGGPVRSKESRDFSKLFKILAREDYNHLNSKEKKEERRRVSWMIFNYINWMFDYKFRRGSNSVNSTSIFLHNSFLNEFERLYVKKLKQMQSQDNLSVLIEWAKENYPEVLEIHQIDSAEDLKMVKKYYDAYDIPEDDPARLFIRKAYDLGLLK